VNLKHWHGSSSIRLLVQHLLY